MKIVVTGTRGIPDVMGGVETHCEQLFPRIAERGFDVTVMRRSNYVKDELREWHGVKLNTIASPKKKSFEAIVHTFRAINKARRIGADVLHIHAIGPALLVPYARLLGMRVVFTHHGPDYDRDKWGFAAKAMLKLGERMGCWFADDVIVISDVIKSLIAWKYGRTRNVHLIYNGVPKAELCDYPEYFDELGIETGKYILGMCRFVPEKNLHHLVEAFVRANPGVKLVLAGDTDFEDSYSLGLKEMARRNGVVLTGFVKGRKLHSLLTNCRCYCLPSSHEGLPIALLEAMSYGVRVVLSDIPANKEVGLPADCYFPCGDVAALAAKLRAVADEPLWRGSYDLGRYDWEKIAGQVAEVYGKYSPPPTPPASGWGDISCSASYSSPTDGRGAGLFFELLQVALGRRGQLSSAPDEAMWRTLFDMAKRQALQGVAFVGVQRLPKEQWPWGGMVMQWMAAAEQVRKRNMKATEVCDRLQTVLRRDGFSPCILKGQANHAYYPQELATMRVCGDVDVWAMPADASPHPVRRTLCYLQRKGLVVSLCWLHAEAKPMDGVPVEVHFHPSFMNTPWLNRRFLSVFKMEECTETAVIDGSVPVRKMRPDYDLVFQLNHVFRHLLDEGVGLRQVLDYYMLLGAYRERRGDLMGREEIMHLVKRCGMARFASALMYVLGEVFAMPREWMLCEPSAKHGAFLLDEMMRAGNFGHYDERLAALQVRRGKTSYQVRHALRRMRRGMRFYGSYPSEAVFEPVARMAHFLWRRFRLYRF